MMPHNHERHPRCCPTHNHGGDPEAGPKTMLDLRTPPPSNPARRSLPVSQVTSIEWRADILSTRLISIEWRADILSTRLISIEWRADILSTRLISAAKLRVRDSTQSNPLTDG